MTDGELINRIFAEFANQDGKVIDGYPNEEPFIAIIAEAKREFPGVTEDQFQSKARLWFTKWFGER